MRFNADQVRAMLWGKIRDPRFPSIPTTFATQKEMADSLGVSPAHLNAVLHGHKPLTPRFLNFLGLAEEVTYTERGNGNAAE